ncbi:MAG: diguanylate cyclase [Candidatus Nanopelagicales bacterium]|nr:diguanylate cyclase [Candidatus Nanopelagicales bacterium]MDZ4249745.1 diguanylate cyclase [Candidatus Nanopelagicales bacterium]MDZ7578646.1 diguanylate cyclase [Candidatus Nanopelagicales bacterium]
MATTSERPYQDLLRWSTGLDKAGWDHVAWLMDWHRAIMCGVPLERGLEEPDAHNLCGFGQWLYGDGADLLESDDRIQSVERIHRRMHDRAREMLRSARQSGQVDPAEYDDLLNLRGVFHTRVKTWQRGLLKQLFNTDPLTGLLNRRSLDSLLGDMICECANFDDGCQIAIVNVDRLKRVNDRHGTSVGDEVLRTLGSHMSQRLRSSDLVVRYRGDQFLVCFPHRTVDQAFDALDRIRRTISGRNLRMGQGVDVTVSVSVGLASWDGSEDVKETIKRAEWAVSEAKRAGRNSVTVAPD